VIGGGNATIFVTDMDGAVAFYTDALGLRLTFRAGDRWASLDADGLQIGLHPASDREPAPGPAGAITVGRAVDEPIDTVVATLTDRGVTFDGPIVDEGMLKLAYFRDPDGNPAPSGADGVGVVSDPRPTAPPRPGARRR
jgi:catechol 2,3-dioxygenase-like lactoylglutathione lyase family enzyme